MNLEPCLPPFWAKGGHAQTLFGHFLPSPRLAHKGRRVELPLPDGDTLVGFIIEGTSKTVVSIFHGLSGNTDSPYIRRSAILAATQNHTVILWNHRGCGEGSGLSVHPYHSGRGEDLSAAIAMGRKLFPKHRHLAVGFSMSGNALLCLASGIRGEQKPDGAIAFNAPIDLASCARLLGRGVNKIYDAQFFMQCRRDVFASGAAQALKDRIPFFTSLYEFDDLFTAPAGGFESREHYYQSCSTHQSLSKITIPTMLFAAADDPFVPIESYRRAEHSSSVHLNIQNVGGHMGYLTRERTPLGTNRWQDYALSVALETLE